MALRMASRGAPTPMAQPPRSQTPMIAANRSPLEVLQNAPGLDSSSSFESTDPEEYMDEEYRDAQAKAI